MVRAPALACIFAGASASAVGDGKRGRPVKEAMPWYHSSDELKSEIADAINLCNGAGADASIYTQSQGSPSVDLDIIHIKKKDSTPDTKAVIVFGEHARELISPESGLDFVKNLCGSGASARQAAETLDKGVEFIIVPNANPIARRKVEDGYYCKRTNEHNVDLNRNWGDDHRNEAQNIPGDEMNPGPMGFSEPETQILRDLVDQEHPDIFLSVHSGAYLLGAPYGYKYGRPQNEAQIDELLKPISEKHCGGGCPYGSLADMIEYKSQGCDIDYVHEHAGVPYAFTWEIYVGDTWRDGYIQKAHDERDDGAANFLQKSRRTRRTGTHLQADSSIEAMSGHAEDAEDPEACIDQFLPKTQSETEQLVENWSGAYLDLAMAVADKKKSGNNATAAAPTTTLATSLTDPFGLSDAAAPDAPSTTAAAEVATQPESSMDDVPSSTSQAVAMQDPLDAEADSPATTTPDASTTTAALFLAPESAAQPSQTENSVDDMRAMFSNMK